MTKKFDLIQLFSIVDGRLSNDIGDVYEMMNHICDDNLMTHHLPVAMKYIENKTPKWLKDFKHIYNVMGCTEDIPFEECLSLLKLHNDVFDIPQLKDEVDTSDFSDFMINNSLLLKNNKK